MLQRSPSFPVTISGGGDRGVSLGGGGKMGVASTASRGCGSCPPSLTGVELEMRLRGSEVSGLKLSSRREQGWRLVPNFLLRGIALTRIH